MIIKDWNLYLYKRIDPDPHTGCWNWTGRLHSRGDYGRWGRKAMAHRKSFELFRGPIPHGLLVLHECDNRRCVNPYHLFLGTNDDNLKDMAAKGRSTRGERSSRAKLTEAQVREIKASAEHPTVLAARYGVGATAIYNIRSGFTWGWLQTEGGGA